MIALILAAGRGSRLGDYTNDTPKSLLQLNSTGLTLLDYNLNTLESIGVDRILIVTGYRSEDIENAVSDRKSVEIIYNPFWDCCNVLGSMYMALPQLNDDFFFLHADTLLDANGWKLLINTTSAQIILPYEAKECGDEEMKIIVESDNSVTKISKLLNHSDATGEFVGIAKFSKDSIPTIVEIADKLFKGGSLNHYMEAALAVAIDEKLLTIEGLDITGNNFVEVDFEEDYIRAKSMFG